MVRRWRFTDAKGAMKVRRRAIFLLSFVLILIVGFGLLSLAISPGSLFSDPSSTVLFDRDGGLLGARIAADGQWRFEASGEVPEKYKACLIEFEDRHFFQHPGVNIFSLGRALVQNIREKKIVSGGSTITMQVIRMSRGSRQRTVWQKLVEMAGAVRLEIKDSKEGILQLYAGHAPYGGNVVGLEAASWRYFGRSPDDLSWAESATLAVLPNAPALIHPGRNRKALKDKRDRLLSKLLERGKLDSVSYELAVLEPLPQKPLPLPHRAEQLLDHFDLRQGGRIESSLHPWMQDASREIIARHYRIQAANEVHNMAALILDNHTGEVLVYIGNSEPTDSLDHAQNVDIIRSVRSSGSILKPILYAGMLDAGELLPGTLIADIPSVYRGFTPHNFTHEYDGAVHADEALIRSLNVPAVRMLRQFGILRFYDLLKQEGISTLNRQADDYGLTLILGGAEVSLWDLCHLYSSWARTLEAKTTAPANKGSGLKAQDPWVKTSSPFVSGIGADAIFFTLQAMKHVRRPDAEAGWQQFLSAHSIAWKTGTSFGYRDAWAIGLSPSYTVGVWVGNADGEGRPGLTGLSAAAPVLFDLFNLLPDGGWFEPPEEDVVEVAVCRESGMRASEFCTDTDTIWIPAKGLKTGVCPYHLRVNLDQSERYRVNSDCYPVNRMVGRSWFVLPPAMAFYYKAKAPFYRELPPWKPGCQAEAGQIPFELLYPHPAEEIYLPINENGEKESVVCEAVHSRRDAKLFWFLDQQYIASTERIHKVAITPEPGKHRISITDDQGNQTIRNFIIR